MANSADLPRWRLLPPLPLRTVQDDDRKRPLINRTSSIFEDQMILEVARIYT